MNGYNQGMEPNPYEAPKEDGNAPNPKSDFVGWRKLAILERVIVLAVLIATAIYFFWPNVK